MTGESLSRRQLLKLGGSTAIAAIAGCNTGSPDAQQTPTGTDAPTETGTTGTETPVTPTDEAESPYTAVYRETIGSVVLVQRGQGQGTGFVFDGSHVVTNAHVVGTAPSTDVRFSTGEWRTGEVVGRDAHSDLAAIAVDDVPDSAPPLPFVDSEPTVGQEVVAIGNPFNLDGSVTTGVVSGKDRSIPAPTGFSIPDAVQTDAAVNPGNSGGPLVSLDGRVVAVINSGGGENIAFGISAALTQRVVPRLVETGDYEHSYVGVGFEPVSPTVAGANDMAEPRGLIVVRVVPDGPAAGVLQPSELRVVDGQRVPVGGDVILAIDGTEIATSEDLGSYLALQTRPGDTVELAVLRDGERRTVDLELGTRPGGLGS